MAIGQSLIDTIDQMIADYGGQKLLDSNRVIDDLLDLRNMSMPYVIENTVIEDSTPPTRYATAIR